MTLKEAGQVLGISEPTAVRWWLYAKTWLYKTIRDHSVSERESPPDP
jgi:hypothetical protein